MWSGLDTSAGREVEGEREARRPAQGTGTGSLVGPYFMLLSQKLGKLPIATHSLLRQARARPLHQHKVVLVDRSRWHLRRKRLVGTGLQAHQEQLLWDFVIVPAHYSYLLCGASLNSHRYNKTIFWAPKPMRVKQKDGFWRQECFALEEQRSGCSQDLQ